MSGAQITISGVYACTAFMPQGGIEHMRVFPEFGLSLE